MEKQVVALPSNAVDCPVTGLSDDVKITTGLGTGSGPGAGDGVGVGEGMGVGLGLGVGDGTGVGLRVGVGDGAAGAATTTSCSALCPWPRASVTVSRTYLVPTSWKVKAMVGPVPSSEASASSVHLEEHGTAKQVVALPLNETA